MEEARGREFHAPMRWARSMQMSSALSVPWL